ncbi:MAG TPA: hypothetical protein VHJ82_10230 [Actinomycetota bacterium]|nr:hypothetical protein [Actinomycetota bacterium]
MRLEVRLVALLMPFALMGPACDDAVDPIGVPSPAATLSELPSPSALPTPTPTVTNAAINCSAADLDSELGDQEGLPPAVADVRLEIARLAVACDYDGLETLALDGRDFFSFSFGADESPGRYWRRDDRRYETLATLVRLFELPYVTSDFQESPDEPTIVVYSWPSANGPNPTEEDWQQLIDAGLYTENEVEQMKDFGGYIGYRIGILEDGDWIYFIAGD